MKIIKQFLMTLILAGMMLPGLALAQPVGSTPGTGGGIEGADSNSTAMERLRDVVGDPDSPTFDVDHTDEDTLTEFIGLIVSVILGLLGVIFTLLIVVAGYTYMMAGGNEEKVSKALSTIKVALIGLVIVIGAFAIWRFVFERIVVP